MSNPGFDNLERLLKDGLQAIKRDALKDEPQFEATVKRVGPGRKDLIPVLVELMECSSGTLQACVIDAIGRQKQDALTVIPSLAKVLSRREDYSSAAAALALGRIPDQAAVKALIAELDRIHLPFGSFVLRALSSQAERASEALPKLLAFLDDPDTVPERLRGEIANAIQAISGPLPSVYQGQLAQARFSDFIPIRFSDRKGEDPVIFFARYGGSPNMLPSQPEHGLLIDKRLKFKSNCESECGLKIYRGARNENIIVLTGGKGSYGTQPWGLPDELATMILSYYRLDAKSTHWFLVDQHENSASCKKLEMQFNFKTGEYSQPREKRVPSLARALRAFGIEL